MKKAIGICVYQRTILNKYVCHSFTVIIKSGDAIPLTAVNNKQFNNIKDLANTLLKIASLNDFNIEFVNEFDAKLYNLYWLEFGVDTHPTRFYM